MRLVNGLILGSPRHLEAALAQLRPYLRPPLIEWTPGAPLRQHSHARTVVLHHVEALTGDEQALCLRWLRRAVPGQPQVISTSTAPVFPLVSDGRFLAGLYYRLNTILITPVDMGRIAH